MSAILVLLALLSVATLASRRGYAAFVAHIVSAPLLIALGVLIAPSRLAFLTPSTMEALVPAMRVGAAWLALLVGLRTARPEWTRAYGQELSFTIAAAALSWLTLSAATFGLLSLLATAGMPVAAATGGDPLWPVGLALLLGGALASTGLSFARESLVGQEDSPIGRRVLFFGRHDEAAGALALCAAIALWPLPDAVAPIYREPALAAATVVLLGLSLAVSLGFLGGSRMGGASATWVALLGLLTLASGLSASTLLPEAGLAFFFGAAVAVLGLSRELGAERLAQTERPVRLVVLVLIGAHLGFTPSAVVLGSALALARLGLKALLRFILQRVARGQVPLSALLGSSSMALPLTLSFALTRPESLGQSEVLTTVAVAVSLTDLFTLLVWRRDGRDPSESEPEPVGAAGASP